METSPQRPNIWQRSEIVRFLRWQLSWRGIRYELFVLACLVTLIALFYAEENWNGKRAWEKYKREWEAKGERFDLAAIMPPAVPDDQNFAMTPLLKPLLEYDWTAGHLSWRDLKGRQRAEGITPYAKNVGNPGPSFGSWKLGECIDLNAWQSYYRSLTNPIPLPKRFDLPDTDASFAIATNDFPLAAHPGEPARDVLLALSRYDLELREISESVRRSYSRFPLHYEEGMNTLVPHLSILRTITHTLVLRAVAHLALNETEQAHTDTITCLFTMNSIGSEPLLISQLVRLHMCEQSLQPIWEGLTRHRWNDEQLSHLQAELARTDFVAACARAMRGERTLINLMIERTSPHNLAQMYEQAYGLDRFSGDSPWEPILSRFPFGWRYRNILSNSRMFQEYLLSGLDPKNQRIDPKSLKRSDEAFVENIWSSRSPYHILVKNLYAAESSAAIRLSFAQTAINEAHIACALERYRLVNGNFPEQLDALVPHFIEKLPHDVITGQALKYRRTEADSFILYSVGWNEVDDGGVVAMRSRIYGPDIDQGDWVWRSGTKPVGVR